SPAFAGRKCACSSGEAALRPLDAPLRSATIPRLPERVAWNCPDDQEFPTTEQPRRKSKSRTFWGLRCVTGAFFTPPSRHIRSLKTQQRAFTSRPRSAGPTWSAGRGTRPVPYLRVGTL